MMKKKVLLLWTTHCNQVSVIYSANTSTSIYYDLHTVLGTGDMTHKISALNTGLQGWGGGLEVSVGIDWWLWCWEEDGLEAGGVGGGVKTQDALSSKWSGSLTSIWWVGKG